MSFSQGELDPNKINIIKNNLQRRELKNYIKELEKIIKRNTVFITSSIPFNTESKIKIESLFPRKKIEYHINQSLIVGLRVIDNDNLYELDLKKILENISSHIIESYD